MHRQPRPDRSAAVSLRVLLLLLASALALPFLLRAAAPDWWTTWGVIKLGTDGQPVASADFAALNQGQLKKLASAAYDEMSVRLPGGAGAALETLMKKWYQTNPVTHEFVLDADDRRIPLATGNDFAAVNLGQLKAVAKPFYDRLIEANRMAGYPWAGAPTPAADFAMANLGQAKNLFSFYITVPPPSWLTAHVTGAHSVHLEWQPIPGAQHYLIERLQPLVTNPPATWNWIILTETATTQYDDTPLAAETLYFYRVSAQSGDDFSPPGPTAWAETPNEIGDGGGEGPGGNPPDGEGNPGGGNHGGLGGSGDTDGDGISDADEVAQGTNPNKADTDGDNVNDDQDGWPLEKLINQAPRPVHHYAVIEVAKYATPVAFNTNYDVIYAQTLPPSGTDPSPATHLYFRSFTQDQPEEILNQHPNLAVGPGYQMLIDVADDGTVIGEWQSTTTGTSPMTQRNFKWKTGDTDVTYVGDGFGVPDKFEPDPTRYITTENVFHMRSAISTSGAFKLAGQGSISGTRYHPTRPVVIPVPGIDNQAILCFAQNAFNPTNNWLVEANVTTDGDMTWQTNYIDCNRQTDILWEYVGYTATANAPQAPLDGNMPDPGVYLSINGGQSQRLKLGASSESLPPGHCHAIEGRHIVLGDTCLYVPDPLDETKYTQVNPHIDESAGFGNRTFIDFNDYLEAIGTSFQEVNGVTQTDNLILINDHVYSLSKLAQDDRWQFDQLISINHEGGILAAAHRVKDDSGNAISQANQIYCAVVLFPVELMVDANRDGKMSFTEGTIHNHDGTTEQKPYQFWLNNDHDQGHTVDGNDWDEDDTYAAADNADTIIQWRRDLEDFTRLWISFKNITDMVKQTDFKVRLTWKPNKGDTWTEADGNPGIRVFKAVEEQDGGRQYLEDDNVAWQQLDGIQGPGAHNNFSQALGTNSGLAGGGSTGQSTVDLPVDFLSGLSESSPYKRLLFEGFSAGKGRLILTLYKGTQKIGEYPPLYLELLDIRDMYERYTVGDENGGAPVRDTAALQTYNMASGYTHVGHTRPFAYADGDPEEKKYILFVHGWNMTPGEKDQFSATAYKRLFWQGYKGRFGIFEWPTTYGFGEALGFDDSNPASKYIASGIDVSFDQTNYDRGEWSAWRSAPMLRALLVQLNQKHPGQVNVIAHSTGNIVTGEALRLHAQNGGGQLVKTYVATQANVPVHCYDATISDNLFAHWGIFGGDASGLDTPNIYKSWLSGNAGVVGKRVKFFNVNDFALWEDIWQLNQWFKPDNRNLPNQPWWYHFTGNKNIAPPEDKFTKSNGPAILGGETRALHLGSAANVQDRYEIMSFAAESYSKALGAMSGPTAFDTAVDMQSLWPADSAGALRPYSAHKWHSAQFRGTNMEQKKYWKKLVGPDAFDVVPQP